MKKRIPTLITDAVDVYFRNLDLPGRQRFLTTNIEMIQRWYNGDFYSLRSRYKPTSGIELASKQTDYDDLVRLFYTIRGFGKITPPAHLYKLTKLRKKVDRGDDIMWNDIAFPMSSWTDDAVASFRFTPEDSLNTTAVSLEYSEPTTDVILMDHFLLADFLEYVRDNRADWIKEADIEKRAAVSLKPKLVQQVKDLTSIIKETREYIVFLDRGQKIPVTVTGTFATSA